MGSTRPCVILLPRSKIACLDREESRLPDPLRNAHSPSLMSLHHPAQNRPFARLPILLPVAAALVLPLGSCNATSGAAIGGLLGAGLGQAAGGDTESTIVGAVIGAGIGAAIGFNVEKKREARLVASRQASAAEREAAERAAAAVSASSRKKAIARAEAYANEHGIEHRAAAVDADPAKVAALAAEEPGQAVVPSRKAPETEPVERATEDVAAEDVAAEEPPVRESAPAEPIAAEPIAAEPVRTLQATNIPESTMIGIVPLPSGEGVMFTDITTGELVDQDVHQLEDIKDVSNDSVKEMKEDDDAKPFTLILSDKKTGKTRQYTAIYNV